MSNRSLVNLLQTMTPAVRQSPLRALFLAVAVALCGLMTVADLPSPAPVHAQEQQVTPTKESTGTAPPERPADLEASASHDSVTLTWTASTDDTVTHYAVLRRDRNADASGVFHVIDANAGPETSYTDASVSPKGSYVYRVKAVSPTGVSQWSSYARADTPPDPADLAPGSLSAKAVSGDDGVIEGVALAWDAPAEHAASVTGYEILRAQGDGEMATLVSDTGSAGATYTDDTATEAGESYAYRVKALRGQEASQPSDRAEAIIPKATPVEPEPPIAERQSATVVWTATLTPGELGGGYFGCSNESSLTCSSSNNLTDDSFTHDSTTYSISDFFLHSGTLELNVGANPSATTIADLTLNVSGSPFLLSDADVNGSRIEWTNTGLSWTAGTDVTVSLTEEAEAVAPTVSSVEVTSEPGADETYAPGETIEVTVTFGATVTVNTSGGTPRIQLRVGGGDLDHLKWADYSSGNGNEALVFAYTVQAGDLDDNGIYIAADELELNGGTIQSADGTDAELAYTLPGTQSGHKVDGVGPTVVHVRTVDGSNSIVIGFDEPLSETTAPASAFTLSVDTGTAPTISSAAASGRTLTLELSSTLTSGQAASVKVTYTDPSANDDDDALQDVHGNDAVNFTTGEDGLPGVTVIAAIEVPANWGLIPSGLGVGDVFRLIFISSTLRNASSADIGVYNSWIQTQVAAGHADIQDYSSSFRVVGSTAAVDANNNTDTKYSLADKGLAIYWLGGGKAADDYEDFYDGSWSNEANAKDQYGNGYTISNSANWPFTGSAQDGTEAVDGSGNSTALGSSMVRLGGPNSNFSGEGPLEANATAVNTESRSLYGLSPVFRVGSQTTTNAAPEFAADTDVRTVPENSPPGTSVGDPVTATDADGDTLTYTLEGTDAASFAIDASTGQITTISGVTYDHEAKSSYSVTVKADDSNGGTDTITVTVSVTDEDEPPATPLAPAVSPVSGSSDSLEVSWTAPDNRGKPDIESYDLQYRQGTSGSWTDGPQDETGLSATITGLAAGTEHQVQVRATNDEGDSRWSAAGTGSTNAQAQAPTVSSVAVTSNPGADETYAIGDTIQVTVTFDAAVTVNTSGGTPRIQLRVGGGDPEHLKWADYSSGNEALVFAYTVQAGDEDTNGIFIAENDLELNGGTIQSADGTDAVLAYTQPGTQSGHKVDGVGPTPEAAWTSLDGASIIILFSEPLAATTAPASAFTLAVDTGTTPVVTSATASGNSVTLGLDSALTADQVVSVMYVDVTSSNDSAAVQDAAGNDAANFTQTISNTVPQPVPSNWGLIPSGLGAGDRFRLVFLSSTTRNGSSANIADYNTFVQTAAAAGHTDIQGSSSTFRVVGSTAADDARDNTATRYTGDDTAATGDDGDVGVPIYWLDGAKVADEYRDFYDGDWDDEANAKDESGNDRSTSGNRDWPFTGSDHDGTEAFSGSISKGLGADLVVEGRPNSSSSGHGPLSSNGSAGKSNARPFYGLSAVFVVSADATTNAAPVFTSDAAFTADENQTAVGTVIATDADAGDTVTYAVTGGDDQTHFQIDPASGVLTFATAPDYESPADAGTNNVYLVTVTATGGTGGRAMTATQDISVTVNDVDETPAVTDVDVTSTPTAAADTYGRDETIEVTVTFDQAVTVTGTPRIQLRIGGGDPQHLKWADYAGGTGTTALVFAYTVQAGDQDDNGIFIEANELFLNSGTIQGVDDDVAATLTYTRQGTQSGHKVDGSGCLALPAGRLWSACLTAGEIDSGGRYGYESPSVGSLAPATFDVGATTYTVTRLFDNDQFGGSTFVRISLSPILSEDDARNLTLHLGDDTSLSFGDASYSTGSSFSSHNWSRSDALGWSAGQKIVVGITQDSTPPATNAAPSFTSDADFSADEDQTAVGTVMATDADAGDTVTYAVTGGADQARFQIGPDSGVLTFATAPDHEDPGDADTNNVYQVTVTATGGTGARAMTATQDISVTVNDVDETPAITSVSVVSDPGADDTYGLGDTIEVQVTFDQAVTVNTSGGAPSIEFEAGGNMPLHLKLATYADGSGTATLRFDYVVQAADMDDNGIWLKADKLELNGGTIQGVDDDVAANLDYTSLGRQDDHKIDGSLTLDTTPPALESATVSEDGTIITLVFDEAFEQNAAFGLATTDFSVTAGGSTVTIGQLGLFADAGIIVVYRTIQLKNLSPAITHGQTVTVSYTDPPGDNGYSVDPDVGVIEDAAGNDVATFTTGLGSVPAVVNNVPAAPTPVPTTWSLVPSGLGDGDSFRLLFIGTSPADARYSDIAVYNTFIQNLAAAGHTDIQAHSATFRVVGSTEDVDARDNTGTTGTGVPIYWLNGAKVADDYADFYDGDWDEEREIARETGELVNIGSDWKIWTGSAHDGTEAMNSGGTESRALGNAGNHEVMQGSPNGSDSTHGPIESDTASSTTGRGLYGLSGVFTVDASLDPVNTPPTFQQENTTREVEENSPAGTAVGDPVTATDADDDTLTYTLEGPDAASFQIVSTSGQIQTKSGITYDYETKEEYAVTVRADDGKGGTDTIAVAIDLLDVDETVATPGAPQNVAATAGTGKVRLTWDAPESEGGGAVTHYEYRRKEGSGSYGAWQTAETVDFGSNSNSAILRDATTLDDYDVKAETTYTYRVRAVNASGGGDASTEDSATTGAAMTVSVEASPQEVMEDQGPVTVTVVAELPATGPNMEKYELEFRVLALTSTVTASGPDYGGLNEFPVFDPDDFRMESGRWIAEKPYRVTIKDDDLFEQDETFRAEVHGGGAGTRHPFVTIPGATDAVTVTILNDDHLPVIPTQQFEVLLEETDAGRLPARDEDGDTLTWTLTGGADQALFTLSSDGQLSLMTARTSLEDPGDNNDNGVYELTVQVSDGHHTPATSGDITVRLIDVAEPPRRPGAPWVRALDGSTDALDVRWAEIEGDAVRSYDLRYREGSSGDWTNGPQDVTGTRATIRGLESGTSYQVQLRATNSKGDSDWSPTTSAGTGTDNDVDAIYAYWTKTLGSEELHEDIAVIDGVDQSSMLVNDCNTTESFRMYWAPARVADEWEYEAFTDGGASNVSINDVHYTNRDPLLPELTGTARLNGLSRVLVRVRGRFGDDWANWSRVAEVMCLPPESGDGQTGQQNVEEDEDEESTAPLTARFLYEGPLGYHSGAGTTLTVRLSFSETVSITPEALGQALALTNATAEAVSRVDGRSDLWEVRLTPHSDGMVTLLLPLAADCDATGAVCTGDGRMLSIGVGTVIPGPPPNSQATGAPAIDGAAEVGQVLSADVTGIDDDNGLDNAEFRYQWLRSDGGDYTEIAGANGDTYALVAADQGKTIKVRVSFTDDEGNPESLTSDPTGEVEAAETVPSRPQDLEGNASAQGIALTWNAPVDSAVTHYVVYRAELDQGQLHGKPMTRYATIDATGATMAYTDAEAEAGVEYRYRVAAVNSAGEGKKSNWINIFAEDS